MARILYSFVYYLLLPFIVVRLIFRTMTAPEYSHRWGERSGIFKALDTGEKAPIWIHAVSVGETNAALPMIYALQQLYPDTPLLVTTMTPTGSERVKSALGNTVHHVYSPYDTPGAVKRFLKRVQPQMLIILETELWPNMIHYTHQYGAKIMLVNARMSERSAQGYARISWLIEPLLKDIDYILAQGDSDADRFFSLTKGEKNAIVTGSIKYDLTIADSTLDEGKLLRQKLGGNVDRSIWVAASTHEGEDEQLLQVHKRLREKWPDLCLILVPRHPERFPKTVVLAKKHFSKVARKSKPETIMPGVAVMVGDTMGELMEMYASADIAFVGGSLIENGGHNPLEPAALSLPVIMGQHVFNFDEICEHLKRADGLVLVNSSEHLYQQLFTWLTMPELAKRCGASGKQFQLNNRGALQAVLDQLATEIQ